MEELMRGKIQAYYGTDTKKLYLGDCLELLRKMKPESVDMIFADPPYFLSNNGITCQGGRMVSVNKASWDEGGDFKENHAFNRRWIRMCRRVLKPGGTIWISGTLHNIYSIGMALQQERYKIINNITWKKTNPPPNLACRCFTHSTETILWARKDEKKARHLFNYEQMKQMNGGKQMKDVWEASPGRRKSGPAGIPRKNRSIYWNGLFWRPQKRGTWYWIRFAVPGQPGWCPESTEGSLSELTITKNIWI